MKINVSLAGNSLDSFLDATSLSSQTAIMDT